MGKTQAKEKKNLISRSLQHRLQLLLLHKMTLPLRLQQQMLQVDIISTLQSLQINIPVTTTTTKQFHMLLWSFNVAFLWPPCVADADIISLPCGFFFLLSFFPRLISAVADWMSTILPHMVSP